MPLTILHLIGLLIQIGQHVPHTRVAVWVNGELVPVTAINLHHPEDSEVPILVIAAAPTRPAVAFLHPNTAQPQGGMES